MQKAIFVRIRKILERETCTRKGGMRKDEEKHSEKDITAGAPGEGGAAERPQQKNNRPKGAEGEN